MKRKRNSWKGNRAGHRKAALKGIRRKKRKKAKRRKVSRKRRRSSSGRRRSNPGMPVVLVNPSGGRMARRRTRRKSKTTKRRRRNPTSYRRRNPRVKFKTAAMHAALGALGGGITYGIHWGVTMIPVANPWAKLGIFAGAAGVASIGVSMYADDRVGSGIAGALGYVAAHEIAQQLYFRTRPQADAGAVYMKEGGAVYKMNSRHTRADAGAVYRKEAGALVGGATRYTQQTGQQSMRPGVFGTSFKDAGASRYVPGPVRWFGPQSWAYRYGEGGANRRYVSAHSS